MKKRSVLLALMIFASSTTMSIAQTYEYDNLNRLTRVTYKDGSIIEYTYDEYGNITKIIKKTKVDINQNPKDKDNNSNNTDNQNQTKDDEKNNNSNSSDTNNQDNSNQDNNSQNSKDKDSSSSGGGGGSNQTPKKSEEINQKEEDKNQENKDKKEEINYLEEKIKFKDIKQNTWYSESVNYVVNKKIMIGTSKDEFSPNKHTTRAMITTILYRLSGDEKPTYENSFKDIKNGLWYTNAILWASQNNIVKGISKDEFKPNDTLTRQQLVTILYNFAKIKTKIEQIDTNLDKYKDKDEISNYAINAMNWAVANGILTGTKIDQLSPKTGVTRAQMAVIIRRFIEKMNY